MEYGQKLKVIVNVMVDRKFDKRSWNEIYDHMLGWFMKGDLSKHWVDGCMEAIDGNWPLHIIYTPGRHYNYMCKPPTACPIFNEKKQDSTENV